jgi:hypothetical protein
VTATVHLLVAVAVSFACVSLAAAVLGRRLRVANRFIPVFAAAAAIAGGLATSSATGLAGADLVARVLVAGAATLVASSAPVWVLLLAASLAAAGATGGPASWLGGAAAGAALAMAGTGLAPRGLRAAAGGATAVAALHLAWPGDPLPTAALGIGAVTLLAAGGLPDATRRLRIWAPWALKAALAVGVVVGVFVVGAAVVGIEARANLEDGVRHVRAGLVEAGDGRAGRAAGELRSATARFGAARARTEAWWVRPALAVPVVGRQVRALSAMAATGEQVASTGALLAEAADPGKLTAAAGQVPVDAVRAIERPATDAVATLRAATQRLDRVRSPWLVPMAARRLDELDERVTRAVDQADSLLMAARLAPGMLGADGLRRYFLAVQTPSELRGSGGFIGNFAEVTADHGHLGLVRMGRTNELNEGGDPKSRRVHGPPDFLRRYDRFEPSRLWQNVTVSPDFPTSAQVIADLYPQSGGQPVDGVVAIDPYGLVALLKVVGPVTVPSWPEPITAANAGRVLLFEQYTRLKGEDRRDFLDEVTDAVWQRLTSRTLSLPDLARAVAPAVTGKHIMLASTHGPEQARLQSLGVAGAMPPVDGDFLGVVAQNGGGSKIDWFLHRAVEADVLVDPAAATVSSTVRVRLRNEAPPKGLPAYIIGNLLEPRLPSGTNRLYVSVYTSLLLDGVTLDGQPTTMESEKELGRNVYSAFLSIPPGATAVLELRLEGQVAKTGPLDAYRLTLFRQAAVHPDDARVRVRVPTGWEVCRPTCGSEADVALSLDRNERLSFRLRRPA